MTRTSLQPSTAKDQASGVAARPLSRMIGSRTTGKATRSSTKDFDYQAPAALYVRKAARLKYMGFEHASLALRYANEELRPQQLLTCLLEVGDARFDVEKIRVLYGSPAYPLVRHAMAKTSA